MAVNVLTSSFHLRLNHHCMHFTSPHTRATCLTHLFLRINSLSHKLQKETDILLSASWTVCALIHVPCIFYYFVLWPTNAQLFHKLSHSYMFRQYLVILSELVINNFLLFQNAVPCIFYYFVLMTNKRTIISQIITLLHVSTLSCHPQWACN